MLEIIKNICQFKNANTIYSDIEIFFSGMVNLNFFDIWKVVQMKIGKAMKYLKYPIYI